LSSILDQDGKMKGFTGLKINPVSEGTPKQQGTLWLTPRFAIDKLSASQEKLMFKNMRLK
jgi:hypothetical protein